MIARAFVFLQKPFVYYHNEKTIFYLDGQNLVPDLSFEDTLSCPYYNGDIVYSKHWFNPSSNQFATPDYYHECADEVPLNFMSYQYPRTGKAFTGIWAYSASSINAREYIETKLPPK